MSIEELTQRMIDEITRLEEEATIKILEKYGYCDVPREEVKREMMKNHHAIVLNPVFHDVGDKQIIVLVQLVDTRDDKVIEQIPIWREKENNE